MRVLRQEAETVWLTQAQMSELFQRERTVITKHINKIYSWKKTHNFLTISFFYPNNRYICDSKY